MDDQLKRISEAIQGAAQTAKTLSAEKGIALNKDFQQQFANLGKIDVSKVDTNAGDITLSTPPIRPTIFTPAELTEAKGKQSTIMSRISELENQLTSKSTFAGDEYKRLDIAQQRQDLTASRNRISQLTSQLDKVDEEYDKAYSGTTASTAFVNEQKNQAKSKLYSQIRTEEGLLSALNNDLNTSLTLLQEATDLELQPIKDELAIKRTQLSELSDYISADEKALYQDALDAIDKQEKEVEQKRKDKGEIQKIALAVAENGGSSSIVRSILTMTDLDQAITAAAPSLRDNSSNGVGGGSDYATIVANLRAQGQSDAEIRAYLDTNTKLTEGSISALLAGSGKPVTIAFLTTLYGGIEQVKKDLEKELGKKPTDAQVYDKLQEDMKYFTGLGFTQEQLIKKAL